MKEHDKIRRIRLFITLFSRFFMIAFVVATIYLISQGYLSDLTKLQDLVKRTGAWGPITFILLQIVQVAIPIFPGGISTIAGVALFGNIHGFILNYFGICIGSLLGFHIAKTFGRITLQIFFKDETLAKYDKWTNTHFTKYFAIAIFLPFAPDDFLCYLAGTTKMSYKTFFTIILIGKPIPLIIYSMGLFEILKQLFWK